MTGKTHGLIGMVVGATISAYGITQGDFAYSLALVTAPTAAILPDIDHINSKAGKLLKRISGVAIVIAVIFVIWLAWLFHIAVLIAIAIFLITAISLLCQIKAIKKAIRFAKKHRGFTHTLLVPFFTLIVTVFVHDRYSVLLLYGFVAGYTSHIIADCFTPRGCPVLFPFTRKLIRFPHKF